MLCILTAILEYMKIYYQVPSCAFVVLSLPLVSDRYKYEKQHLELHHFRFSTCTCSGLPQVSYKHALSTHGT